MNKLKSPEILEFAFAVILPEKTALPPSVNVNIAVPALPLNS